VYRGESNTIKDNADVINEGFIHHWVVETPEKAKAPARHPCSNPDRANWLGVANLEEIEVKRRSREEPSQPWSIRRLGRQPQRGKATRGRKQPHSHNKKGKTGKDMSSSLGSKPMMKERLKSLEEDLQRLKQLSHNLDDFIQNMDIDAGRKLEMLEADITTTKFRL
jgi:hypothetical protein